MKALICHVINTIFTSFKSMCICIKLPDVFIGLVRCENLRSVLYSYKVCCFFNMMVIWEAVMCAAS